MFKPTEEQLKRARLLVKRGVGEGVISALLKINLLDAQEIISQITEESRRAALVKIPKFRAQDTPDDFPVGELDDPVVRQEIKDKIADLLIHGTDGDELKAILLEHLDQSQIDELIRETRGDQFVHPKRISRQDKKDLLVGLKEEGKSDYQIAKAFNCMPSSVRKMAKRINGLGVAAEELLRSKLCRGTTLVNLLNTCGIRDLEEARAAIRTVLPGYLVYEKNLAEGDIGFTVIPDNSNHYEWLNSNKEEKQFKFSLSEHGDYIFVQFDESYPYDHFRLYNFTDVHIGHIEHQKERFLADVEMVRTSPFSFAVLGGDIFEWAHKNSVGDTWEQNLSPMQQVSESAKILMPIRHKLLAYRSGNHDAGRGRLTGTDLAETLAHHLEVPYFTNQTVIDIDFKGQLYRIQLDHGDSGGSIQSVLGDVEKTMRMDSFFVHARMSGHVHNSRALPVICRDIEPGVGMKFKRSHSIVGGSYLGYRKTYAHKKKLLPGAQDLTFFEGNVHGVYDEGKIKADPV